MLPLMEQTQTAERVKLRWQRDEALRKSHLIAVIGEEVIILGYHSLWRRGDKMAYRWMTEDLSAFIQEICNLNLHFGQL